MHTELFHLSKITTQTPLKGYSLQCTWHEGKSVQLHSDILIKRFHIVRGLKRSIADLLMAALIREYLQQTTSGHQSYPSIVPHTEEARFVVLLLDEGKTVRELE